MDYITARHFARKNRKNPTPAEKVFWELVRKRRICAKKFLRQYVIGYRGERDSDGYFIVDFYCHELKLVIEIDGEYHSAYKEHDKYREDWLKATGAHILRFSNAEVLKNTQCVRRKLVSAIQENKTHIRSR